MPNLNIEFLGKKLSSPLWMASGAYQTVGSVIEAWVDKLVENYWSGIVTKSYLGTRPLESWLNTYLWTTRSYRSIAMQNLGPPPVALERDEIKKLEKSTRRCHENGIVVIGNIIGRTLQEWVEMAKIMEEAGCDAVELNFGCPAPPIKGHPTLQERSMLFFEAIKDVKSNIRLPILSKINAQILDRVKLASDCKEAGSDAITAINTVGGIIGIDIDTGIPISSDADNVAVMSGLSGPLIKPIGLRVVAEIASNIEIPICGSGGISNWKDAVEYFMVGASAIQVCTAAMWRGFSVGKRMYVGLKEFLEKRGYESLSDIKGISLQYFKREPTSIRINVHAFIDQSSCSKKCNVCYIACQEGSVGAIQVMNGEHSVNEDVCNGCGLCRVVCPRDAIQLEAIK